MQRCELSVMSEVRKKQKQTPSNKGKGSEIVPVGRQPHRLGSLAGRCRETHWCVLFVS
jgi:hypothetical protein